MNLSIAHKENSVNRTDQDLLTCKEVSKTTPLYSEMEVEKIRFNFIKQLLENQNTLKNQIEELEEACQMGLYDIEQLEEVAHEYEETGNGFFEEAALSPTTSLSSATALGPVTTNLQQKAQQLELEIQTLHELTQLTHSEAHQIRTQITQAAQRHKSLQTEEGQLKERQAKVQKSANEQEQSLSQIRLMVGEKTMNASEKVLLFEKNCREELAQLKEKSRRAELDEQALLRQFDDSKNENTELHLVYKELLSQIEKKADTL